jgi:hypothetical protein
MDRAATSLPLPNSKALIQSARGRQDLLQRDGVARHERGDPGAWRHGFTDEFPVSRFYRGARYGTLGGGTTETLRDLIGKRVLAGLDPVDGILGMGMF